jgi:hypothetical protein
MTLYFEHLEEEKRNNGHGRYVVLTAVALLRIQIMWDVVPYHKMIGSRYFEGTQCCHCQQNYCLSLEGKAPCSFETMGTSHPVIQSLISEDVDPLHQYCLY